MKCPVCELDIAEDQSAVAHFLCEILKEMHEQNQANNEIRDITLRISQISLKQLEKVERLDSE